MRCGYMRLPNAASQHLAHPAGNGFDSTITEASTMRSPCTPFTLRSGSVTPQRAPTGDIDAELTEWEVGIEFPWMYSSS